MPLYLDELWLEWKDPVEASRVLAIFAPMGAGTFPFPEGVRLVAGPWFSNEEAKIILVLDIEDHARTFSSFALGMVYKLIARRRLTPIVEWSALQDLLSTLPPGS